MIKIGDKVRMSKSCKDSLSRNGSHEHVIEFGDFFGIVEGWVNYNCDPNKVGPEVDVRWQPSNLRYAYSHSIWSLKK